MHYIVGKNLNEANLFAQKNLSDQPIKNVVFATSAEYFEGMVFDGEDQIHLMKSADKDTVKRLSATLKSRAALDIIKTQPTMIEMWG